MSRVRVGLLLTGGGLVALLGLGLSLQVGWRRDAARWPHHALFFGVCLGTAGTALLAGQRGVALGPALLGLLSMPRTQPGQADHWRRALVCSAAFGLGGWWLWTSEAPAAQQSRANVS